MKVKSPAQLGAVVRSTRTALNIPVEDLAAMAGTSHALLRRLEQGKATAALQKLFLILDELGIEVHLEPPPKAGDISAGLTTGAPGKRTRVKP